MDRDGVVGGRKKPSLDRRGVLGSWRTVIRRASRRRVAKEGGGVLPWTLISTRGTFYDEYTSS